MNIVGIDLLEEGEANSVVKTFLEERSGDVNFSDISPDNKLKVWQSLFKELNKSQSNIRLDCLACCRILSRDKVRLDECISEENVKCLMQLAGILEDQATFDPEIVLEAKKVLSNLVKQSEVVQTYCNSNDFVRRMLGIIQQHNSSSDAIGKEFDIRLLFLLTALCPEQRNVARLENSALSILNATLKQSLRESQPNCDYICQVLKLIFNLSLKLPYENLDTFLEISNTLNQVFQVNVEDVETRMNVYSNVVTVITNMEDVPMLTEPLFVSDETNLNIVLDLLLYKIENTKSDCSLKEQISPILSVLWNISRIHPPARKFFKKAILPPLTSKDIKEKPEVGASLKNRLVALLTNSDQEVAMMTAEFLFVLCKHDVAKLVKHTGYGNAAGLLARRGLLRGGKGDETFSSDDESDDTEDYQKAAHLVNPIIGCIEEPKKDPLEGMTEEQKEYESMRLVNYLDRLTREGFIQPCRVGEDGRPVPVEHVLQLQEGAANLDKEEDSDD